MLKALLIGATLVAGASATDAKDVKDFIVRLFCKRGMRAQRKKRGALRLPGTQSPASVLQGKHTAHDLDPLRKGSREELAALSPGAAAGKEIELPALVPCVGPES